MRLSKAWTTHMPLLMRIVNLTNKPILELGAGLFSTPLLHWMCQEKNIKLVTYENIEEYLNFSKSFQSRNHSVRLIKDWNEVKAKRDWGVVFIDHDGDRAKSAIEFKDADYVILHDSESEKHYGYEKVWSHFKYRYDWTVVKPWTTVLSNKHDICTKIQ